MRPSTFNLGGYELTIDLDAPQTIALALRFNDAQPNAYGVEKASAEACRAGEMVGDTRRGGSCNFEQYRFIPHCNGTHTECVGHITHERITVHECLKDVFILANLISVEPEKASAASESYATALAENDLLITRRAIEKGLLESGSKIAGFQSRIATALIVRTLPNDQGKLTRTYLEEVPPFFSTEAMRFISELGVDHLLVDTPSIDRIFDEGKLSNHRIFWNVEQGAFAISSESFVHKTITELIYAPRETTDGNYLLNLQIAPFASDASPSRPVLFRLLK